VSDVPECKEICDGSAFSVIILQLKVLQCSYKACEGIRIITGIVIHREEIILNRFEILMPLGST
jgi:hypothetical protein